VSKGQRAGLIALAVAIAAVAFALASPDDDKGDSGKTSADATTSEPSTPPTATTDSRPEERLQLQAHRPTGGVRRIQAQKGEFVRLVVESDAPDEVHLHGYDITRDVRPSEPARFSFRAEHEGVFDLESHKLEDQGRDAVIARLVVQ
jgi:hypothetical protein